MRDINRFYFLQPRQYAWLHKVVRYFGYVGSQPYSGLLFPQIFRMSIAWTKTNSVGAHGGRSFRAKSPCQSYPSYPVRSSFSPSDSPYPPSSLLWLSWPFSRGFLFLWASQHYTLRSLPAWEGGESGGSLQQELHLNVTHPKLSAFFTFSTLLVALYSLLCTALKAPKNLSSLGKGRGRSGSGPHKFRQTFAECVWLDILFCGTPWASQMLKQLKYVGDLGIFTLTFQGPQPVEQKQTQWGFLLKSPQLNHLLVHVRRVPSFDSVRVIRVG